MKSFLLRTCFAAVLAGLVAAVTAAADPNGQWTWSKKGVREGYRLTLKAEGEKLTDTLTLGDEEQEIRSGTYKDGTVRFEAFTVDRRHPIKAKYEGTVEEDKIHGIVKGGIHDRVWTARRPR